MFSIYIHYPFCVKKCNYCSFVSAPARSEAEREEYAGYLERELSLAALTPGIGGSAPETIYFGGGTPSLMPAAALERLMSTVGALFGVAAGAEVTVECNPGSVADPKEWLSRARAAGVNRAVVGAQSFSDATLAFMGRLHRKNDTESFYRAAREAGFDSVGVDLIYGLPGRTVAEWQHELEAALALRPDHVSLYCLEITPGTPFGSELAAGRMSELEPEAQEEMYFAACETLEAAGLPAYEISNFARPGFECRHNLVYWRGGDYYAAGLSACSCLGGWRWENEREIDTYKKKVEAGMLPRRSGEFLSPDRRLRERVIMALRAAAGFRPEPPRVDYERALISDLDLLAESGALEKSASGAFLLPKRHRFISDSIFSRIV
ncbi:MAG: radical SAM family heme chaperone HemW [bacterium]